MNKTKKEAEEVCMNCGHEAKSHHGFSCWEKKDWGWCHKYKQCKCKKFNNKLIKHKIREI